MADLTDVKNYLKKLQRVVEMDNEFTLFGICYIKKTKVDDVLCCFISALPQSFKKEVQLSKKAVPSSIRAYKSLLTCVHAQAWFNKELYSIDIKLFDGLVNTILSTIEYDINRIEEG